MARIREIRSPIPTFSGIVRFFEMLDPVRSAKLEKE